MGCWNKTCGLSNLHITAGTPVYTFVLEYKNLASDDGCYSTSLFRPLLLPFTCEYDDYGGGENSTGLPFQLIMNAIKQDLVEMDQGDNQYHDIAVKRDSFGEHLFFESVHEGRLAYKKPYSDKVTQLTFTMFRKDIVDDILERRVIERYVGDGKGTHGWGKNYVRYRYADIIASLPTLLADITERLMDETDPHSLRLFMGPRAIMGLDYSNLALEYLGFHDSYRYSSIVDVAHLMQEGLADGSPIAMQRLQEVLTEYIKGVFIDGFMSSARKTWIPGGHEGSQSHSGGSLRLLYESTMRVVDAERDRWREENEEDPSEDDPDAKYLDD